ncbi:MAG: hypothetical protein K0U84_16050, partial [Actinomycetia bacterium]|nr:hypothetical protein [Actinomycetes bacterium]
QKYCAAALRIHVSINELVAGRQSPVANPVRDVQLNKSRAQPEGATAQPGEKLQELLAQVRYSGCSGNTSASYGETCPTNWASPL